jgi:flavin reductase (DIM6/NTAB) family NADH-FMN oxidoreductase RutF
MADTAAVPPGDVADAFRHAMRRMAATVTIVTTSSAGLRCGVTATSVASVSMSPASLLVCLHRQGFVHARLAGASAFCVNVLRAGQEDLSRAFAGGLTQQERFSAFADRWNEEDGIPFLQDAQCALFCSAEHAVDWGTHTVFFGSVRKVRLAGSVSPLLYCNGGFARLEPAACGLALSAG